MTALRLFILFVMVNFFTQAQVVKTDSIDSNIPLNVLAQEQQDSSMFDVDFCVKNYISSFKDIQNPMEGIKSFADSSIMEKLKPLSRTKPEGNLLIGFDHGLLLGYIDSSNINPISVLRSEGDLGLNAMGLPLRFSYNYSSFRNPLGVNNFMRFSLDTEKLKAQTQTKRQERLDDLNNKLKKVNESKRALSSKLGYGEVLQQRLEGEIARCKKELQVYPQAFIDKKDSLASSYLSDSTTSSVPGDSLFQANQDSISQSYLNAQQSYQEAVNNYDTIQLAYNKCKKAYNAYDLLLTQLNEKRAAIQGSEGGFLRTFVGEKSNSIAANQKEGLLGKIKTFDLGMTYPQTTALSDNSVPMKGLNVAVQHKQWYTSFAAGALMNNLMVSNDIVQNRLLYAQNLFNQFDFQEVTDQGFLVNVKSGLGTVDGSHAFLGFRYLSNAKMSLDGMGADTNELVPTVALELDLRAKPNFLPGTVIDLVYGKTSDSKKVKNDLRSGPLNSLFSNDRTHTSLLKVTQPFKRFRSVLTGSVRWLDPDADVKSLGVLQPNNLRYEVKSTHKLLKHLNFGLNYRLDRNNLDYRMDTTITLSIVGGKIDGAISQSLHYFASLNYLVQQEQDRDDFLQERNNYMYGAGISAQYKVNDISSSIILNYNDYLLTDQVSTALFRNIGLQHLTNWTAFTNGFSVNYFESNEETTDRMKSTIIGDELSYQNERLTVSVGLKCAFQENGTSDFGGKIEFITQITKALSWSVLAEKLVMGDFYRSYEQARFNRFPYVISTNLNFTIH